MSTWQSDSPLRIVSESDSGSDSAESKDRQIADLEKQVAKLTKINKALINRVEHNAEHQGSSFSLFQTAILLEQQVRERTEELQHALADLEKTNRDLSEANRSADKAHTRMIEAIESLSEGFVLFDSADRLVLYNSNFRSIFAGMSDLVSPGTTFTQFLKASLSREMHAVPAEEREKWFQRRLARHRKPRGPIMLAMTDGRWLQVNERATRTGGRVGIYTDVTEIKNLEKERRERALEEKSIQLTATLDHLDQGVSVFDQDHQLAYWNERFVSLMELPDWLVEEGMPFVDMIGSHFVRRAFPGTDFNADLIRWSRSDPLNQAFRAEYNRHDGLVIEVQRNAMPGGGFISTYTDVTERRRASNLLEEAKEHLERRVAERTAELMQLNEELSQAKAAAEKANLSKTKFLAAASHDLLQPLNAARLFVSALPEKGMSGEVRRQVQRVDTALESVDELLKALFDISKLDTGVIHPEWSDFSAKDFLDSLSSEFVLLAQKKGLDFRIVESTATLRSDLFLLRRVLQNFLSNAIRYTPQGRVLLGCRQCAESVRVEVWDTGPGIPDECLEFVFDEFQRFVPPSTHADSGFGLGLAIAKRSARILGHPLAVRSIVGRGSVFSVEVPLGSPEGASLGTSPRTLSRSLGLENTTVLFVENDRDNLDGMTALLSKWSCNVLTATGPQEAVEAVRSAKVTPDLIVADYHLDDDMTGLNAIREIRAACKIPIPGIIITADHGKSVQEAVRQEGMEILQKPVKPAALRALMTHVLA